MPTLLKILLVILAVMIMLTTWSVYVASQTQAASQPLSIKVGKWIGPLTIEDIIKEYAEDYGVNPDVLLAVGMCESSLLQYRKDGSVVHNAADPNSGSWGIFQYQTKTWNGWVKERGIKADINNTNDQIQMTAWAFGKNYQNNWSCYKKLYGLR